MSELKLIARAPRNLIERWLFRFHGYRTEISSAELKAVLGPPLTLKRRVPVRSSRGD